MNDPQLVHIFQWKSGTVCYGMLHMLSTIPIGIVVSSDKSVLMHLFQAGQKFAVFLEDIDQQCAF